MRSISCPAFCASSRQRLSSFSKAFSSTSSFFDGWRSTPGTIPATSQLDRLISITAISVPSCLRGVRDRLRSFNFAWGAPSVHISADECHILTFLTAAACRIASPLEALGRRPPNLRCPPSCGRHPKPFTISEVGPCQHGREAKLPSRSTTTETLAKTVDQLDQHYRYSGCNPGKCPDTRRMVFASTTGSRDIAHDRYLCISV